jgi:hypothetical protein
MDFVNLQVLQCIICKYEQAYVNASIQKSILHNGLVRDNKINYIIPMNTHVQTTHLKLFSHKNNNSMIKVTKFAHINN